MVNCLYLHGSHITKFDFMKYAFAKLVVAWLHVFRQLIIRNSRLVKIADVIFLLCFCFSFLFYFSDFRPVFLDTSESQFSLFRPMLEMIRLSQVYHAYKIFNGSAIHLVLKKTC